MRCRSTSTAISTPSFMVAASGCAPPMPPRPAVTTSRPASDAAEVLARGLGEGLVGALQDALGADVDPGARRHLAVHHQALAVELVEVLPGGPGGTRFELAISTRGASCVRAEDAHRLARLHQQRLVVAQLAQRAHDGVEALPVARRLADAAVDDQVLGPLGHLGVEVVHQHAQRRLLLPAPAGERRAARGADRPRSRCRHVTHRGLPLESSVIDYSSAVAGRFRCADHRPRASELGERLDLGRERSVVAVRRDARADGACTASSGGDERSGPAEVERLARGEQLDREHARACSRRRGRPCAPPSGPSRRGLPCRPRWESSRRSRDGRASCSPRRAPRP